MVSPGNVDELLGPTPPAEWPRAPWVLLLQEEWRQLGEAVEELPEPD